MPRRRELPRSLAPLEDESLPGFVLRLAHHNTTSPGEIAIRTGLSAHRRAAREFITVAHQYHMDDERIAELARTTRLTFAEAADLFLFPFADRYGPISPKLVNRQLDRMLYSNRSVFSHWSRYCPQCLAGDSEIERAHGGSWKRRWRLPPVFACPTHHCLLRHDCPECHQPGLVVQFVALVPQPYDDELHPSQCRAVRSGSPGGRHSLPCGARHGQAEPPTCSTAMLQHFMHLQHKLLKLLSPDGPTTTSVGWPTGADRYFFDLRTISGLIALTWPAGRHLTHSTEHADILDADAERRHQATIELRKRPGKRHHTRPLTDPAPDALSCAAITAIADTILSAKTDTDALALIAPLQYQLRDLDGPARAVGSTLRSYPHSSLPLRILLARRTQVTPDLLRSYGSVK